jgi:hypothetical protein
LKKQQVYHVLMGLAQEQAAGVTDAEQNIWNCHSVSFTTIALYLKI